MRRLVWILLGTAGVLQAMLIASGYNELLQEKSVGYGPNGPMEVQFHGSMYLGIGWLVIIAVGAIIVAATFMRFYEALATVAIGTFFIGALYQNMMPDTQAQLWPWGAGAALVALGLAYVYVRLGFYERPVVPASPAGIMDRQSERDPLE